MTEVAWVTDSELGIAAHRLGEKIIEMYAKAEIGSVGGFGPNHDGTLIESVILDASDFTSLDPQKIIDESERMRSVVLALGGQGQAKADLDQAATILATRWSGEAAGRFHDQMKFIQYFLEDHARAAERPMVALGMALAVSVQARSNYLHLAEGTIVACDQEITAQVQRTAEADTKRTATLINSVLGLFSNQPGELVVNGIESVVSITAAEMEIDLKVSNAPEVVMAYTRGRDQLRADYDDALTQVTQWLDRESAGLSASEVTLFRPLPASYSPSSPDFRYEMFASGSRSVAEFGPVVERDGRDSGAPDPDSPVSRRLAE
ncbi:hypothetical protein ACFPM7_25835 [Actinokineospora guangxiensis]|uniref:Uncharacterized protein n=1 Tax=Actinokineospora guangxiensis TaxID=1490288 RepID=A0ABW0EVQ5_9PSEU